MFRGCLRERPCPGGAQGDVTVSVAAVVPKTCQPRRCGPGQTELFEFSPARRRGALAERRRGNARQLQLPLRELRFLGAKPGKCRANFRRRHRFAISCCTLGNSSDTSAPGLGVMGLSVQSSVFSLQSSVTSSVVSDNGRRPTTDDWFFHLTMLWRWLEVALRRPGNSISLRLSCQSTRESLVRSACGRTPWRAGRFSPRRHRVGTPWRSSQNRTFDLPLIGPMSMICSRAEHLRGHAGIPRSPVRCLSSYKP